MCGFLAGLNCRHFDATAFAASMLLFAAAAALILAACATSNVDPNYALAPASGKGVVIGSLTFAGELADYRLLYRKTGGGEEGYFQLKSTDPTLNAGLIAAELPAGDYEFYLWLIYPPGEATEISPDSRFSIPFHVAPGKAAYFGSCAFSMGRRGTYYFGYRFRVSVVCDDRLERDLSELEAHYPYLAPMAAGLHASRGEFYRSAGFKVFQWEPSYAGGSE